MKRDYESEKGNKAGQSYYQRQQVAVGVYIKQTKLKLEGETLRKLHSS
jgi:hypothetical protein